MKAAKKQKSPRKPGKKKAQSATVPRKLVSKKSGTNPGGKAGQRKTPTRKVRSGEPATIKKVHAENQRLTRQLEQKNRELQIEAVLERVRARTISMHDSSELAETATMLFHQFQQLGMLPSGARPFFRLIDTATDASEVWTTKEDGILRPGSHHVPMNANPSLKKVYGQWRSKVLFFVRKLSGESVTDYLKFLSTLQRMKDDPILHQLIVSPPELLVLSEASFKQGTIGIISLVPLSQEAQSTMQRFAKAFEQTYTRFLDLKKAEAQAREAQIEAALEKVRSTSLAMHHSDELQQVVATLFGRLVDLGLSFNGAIIWTFDREKRNIQIWVAANAVPQPVLVHLPYDEDFKNNPIIIEFWDAVESGRDTINRTYSGKVKDDYFAYTAKYNDETVMPENLRKLVLELDWTVSFVAEKNSLIGFDSWTGQQTSNEDFQILKRFARVFEQSYTRFLDLQKAEAQAREAQIETALERVRARTMAMRESSELIATAELLFDQLSQLGAETQGVAFAICDENSGLVQKWTSIGVFSVPYDYEAGEQRMYEAWKNKIPIYEEVYEGDRLRKYYELFMEIPEFRNGIQKFIDSGHPIPSWQKNHAVPFTYGYLLLITTKPFEEKQIFSRFAKVFEQTYTRFLDLQKAEAQAREAKIENALEKVRSRSLAMHRSDDLKDVVSVMFEKLKELGCILDGGVGVTVFAEGTFDHTLYVASPNFISEPVRVQVPCTESDIKEHQWFTDLWNARRSGENIINRSYSGDIKNKLFNHIFTFNDLPSETKDLILKADSHTQSGVMGKNSFLGIDSWIGNTINDNQLAILKRMSNVFEQAYVRFLDLKKAETQAREAQIEAALERVRSKAMSMQKSDDLSNAVAIVFEELDKLKLGMLRCGIGIIYKKTRSADLWTTTKSDNNTVVQVSGDESMDIHPLLSGIFDAWVRQDRDFEYVLQGKDLNDYYKALTGVNFKLPDSQSLTSGAEEVQQFHFNVLFPAGGLFAFRETPFPDEAKNVMRRFADVFNLTYTRFSDLKQAEAQAREARIEAALERIRSRSLAMHKSEELSDVIKVVSEQLQHLGFKFDNASFVLSSAAEDYDFWFSIPGQHQPHHIHVPYLDNPINNNAREARAKGLRFHADIIDPAASRAWHQHMFDHNPMDFLSDEAKHIVLKGGFARSVAITSNIMLVIGNYASKPYSEDENAIIRRFAIVFEQSYTRFLDLQKAEAQAREAQIEAALEKVRSRSLAMHHSTELEHVAGTLFDRLAELGLSFDGALIFIFDKEKRNISLWIATNQLSAPVKIDLPYDRAIENNAIIKDLWNAIENSEHIINRSYSGEVKNDYFRYVVKYNEKKIPESVRQLQIERETWTAHLAAEKNSMIGFDSWSGHLTKDEDFKILIRFAKVFEQAYTRFLDLQKAEAQAREATIEAALERVRARALGMHSSDDLSSTANTVFIELKALGIQPIRCGVGLLSRDTTRAQLYSSTSTNQENILSLIGFVNLTGHPVLDEIYASWISGADYFPSLSGESMKSYYELLLSGLAVPKVPDWQADEKQYGHFFPFSVGCLYAWSASAYDEKEIKILKRFTTIIDLTFRRYLELQKSEASTRDAIRQASLDRVRAEIASMRTTKDLERITPLVWKELTIQNIPFIRCGVFIMDEDKEIIHNYLTTPDGNAIAAFQLPYSTPGAISRILKHWQERKIFLDHWDDPAVREFAIILVERGIFNSVEQYLDTLPKGGFYLHFLPFNQGMLYVGNTAKLKEDEVQLIQSLADAFSTAYARYEDFNRLEAAKQQVDKTLVDLKQTQQQLVQSEKMASLGELTAGIAHEIQNPLNFVNNFSEVSNELLEEMHDEIQKGNIKEVQAIAMDVKQNLEKILHHGKRADGIVKGMLQHSRTGSGQKEPTDINVLCDEYLRLAYHGLRAKDKSFNSRFETELDPSLPKVNVLPPDIGRAILNLINNAFYAVDEKKKLIVEGYEPTVTVSTKNYGDKIEIRIQDNGVGVPDKVKDKIFQPFFTTKPTGQGTGLGLSLAYDIVTKGHGGKLLLSSEDGIGSTFIIELLT